MGLLLAAASLLPRADPVPAATSNTVPGRRAVRDAPVPGM